MKSLLFRLRPRQADLPPPGADPAGIEIERSDITPLIYHIESVHDERNWDMTPASRIGAGICFQGEIQQDGSMTVEGEVTGKVVLQGPQATLLIAQGGAFGGEAYASNVEIRGRSDATITAAHVAIHESATTRGAIVYDRIEMHGGDNDISLKRNPARQL